jgi:D-alanine--poly(phosphoribitol) ligase subunit 1
MYIYNLGLLFERVVEEHPENPALKFPDNTLIPYNELNRAANRTARLLLDRGIASGDVVCIFGHKVQATYVTMLACLKIGAPYAILDPDSPIERLGRIVQRCQPKMLVGQPALTENLQQMLSCLSLDINRVQSDAQGLDASNLPITRTVPGTTPAYIMFTSGSTGFPKGAVIPHHSVMNFIGWSVETFGITPADVLTNVNPLYFDNSVFDFYASIFSGACLVPFSKEIVSNPRQLVELIDAVGCTSWFSVPSLLIYLQTMRVLNPNNMTSIRRYIFGGEGYPKVKLKELFDLYSTRAAFFNVYGPTECTCICSAYVLCPEDFDDLQGFPALGSMASNFGCLILDENNRIVGDNETGVLFLSGPNVGLGYYNDPDQTSARFVQNPHNTQYIEYMYDTGDLVRYNPDDGKIYISGRKDHQIKHMGYRIELEEIENALNTIEYVAQAAVIHQHSKGLSQIVGIVSLKGSPVDSATIRKDLRALLPDYMIPQTFHVVPELPKNANGKIDRPRLAEMY